MSKSNNVAQSLRRSLCDELERSGPDAPTLCAGWSARDLATHLIVRETRPDAAVGILVKPLAGYAARVQRSVGKSEWATIIHKIRSGPPLVSPMRVPAVDDLTNTRILRPPRRPPARHSRWRTWSAVECRRGGPLQGVEARGSPHDPPGTGRSRPQSRRPTGDRGQEGNPRSHRERTGRRVGSLRLRTPIGESRHTRWAVRCGRSRPNGEVRGLELPQSRS